MVNKHPGKFIKQQLIKLDLSVTSAAKKIGVTRKSLSELINCRYGVSPIMAIRLHKLINIKPEKLLWMQMKYDLKKALN